MYRVILTLVLTAGAFAAVASVWPAALAPAWREFSAKCERREAARSDLIALKRLIAASAVDGATKSNLTAQARAVYRASRTKKNVTKVEK